jgi:pSer/pThr/pTyr-binding forkhead associated (FHA) protein
MPVVGLLIDRQRTNRRFDVAKPVVTIGRAQTSDVVIDDATVSRQHATIKWEDNRFRVYDLGSSNGTFVGEQRVREPVDLADGALVRFGAVELVFKVV